MSLWTHITGIIQIETSEEFYESNSENFIKINKKG